MAGAFLALAFSLVGCATQPVRYFDRAEDEPLPSTGTRVAVLCGNPSGASQLYASLVAAKFRESGTYSVLSDSDIRRVYKDYPVNIVGSETYILQSDIPHLAAIGKALSVDYVFTVWVYIQENSYNGVKQSFDILFRGSLLSVRTSEYVGASGFGWREPLPAIDKDMKVQTQRIVDSIHKAAGLVYEDTLKASRLDSD